MNLERQALAAQGDKKWEPTFFRTAPPLFDLGVLEPPRQQRRFEPPSLPAGAVGAKAGRQGRQEQQQRGVGGGRGSGVRPAAYRLPSLYNKARCSAKNKSLGRKSLRRKGSSVDILSVCLRWRLNVVGSLFPLGGLAPMRPPV